MLTEFLIVDNQILNVTYSTVKPVTCCIGHESFQINNAHITMYNAGCNLSAYLIELIQYFSNMCGFLDLFNAMLVYYGLPLVLLVERWIGFKV